MISNFVRFQEIQKQANSESYSSLSHVEPRNLPRSPDLGPRSFAENVQKFLQNNISSKRSTFAQWNGMLPLLVIVKIVNYFQVQLFLSLPLFLTWISAKKKEEETMKSESKIEHIQLVLAKSRNYAFLNLALCLYDQRKNYV